MGSVLVCPHPRHILSVSPVLGAEYGGSESRPRGWGGRLGSKFLREAAAQRLGVKATLGPASFLRAPEGR